MLSGFEFPTKKFSNKDRKWILHFRFVFQCLVSSGGNLQNTSNNIITMIKFPFFFVVFLTQTLREYVFNFFVVMFRRCHCFFFLFFFVNLQLGHGSKRVSLIFCLFLVVPLCGTTANMMFLSIVLFYCRVAIVISIYWYLAKGTEQQANGNGNKKQRTCIGCRMCNNQRETCM